MGTQQKVKIEIEEHFFYPGIYNMGRDKKKVAFYFYMIGTRLEGPFKSREEALKNAERAKG